MKEQIRQLITATIEEKYKDKRVKITGHAETYIELDDAGDYTVWCVAVQFHPKINSESLNVPPSYSIWITLLDKNGKRCGSVNVDLDGLQ